MLPRLLSRSGSGMSAGVGLVSATAPAPAPVMVEKTSSWARRARCDPRVMEGLGFVFVSRKTIRTRVLGWRRLERRKTGTRALIGAGRLSW